MRPLDGITLQGSSRNLLGFDQRADGFAWRVSACRISR
jgi:hypothetical protein